MKADIHTSEATKVRLANHFDQVYEQLPALESPEFLALLANASKDDLPAQVLVRVYRHLLARGNNELAQITLSRLLDENQQHGYLVIIRHLARRRNPDQQQWHDEEDLYQAALIEILKVLPTPRGELAENAWVRFCQNCFTDAWRNFHGRRGERLQTEFAQPTLDDETGAYQFHVESAADDAAPWHSRIGKSELIRVEALVNKTINSISDPFIKAVAEDQFSASPSPISSPRDHLSKKIPLTTKLNASRFQISRALRSAKARLAAEILNDQQLQLEREWLKSFLR